MSLFVFKICSVSVIITSNKDGKRPNGQQILWMPSASSPTFRQTNVTIEASLSLVRGLSLISMTNLYDVLSLLFKLLNFILYLKIVNSHLCYFLLNIVIFICFSTYFSDNITLCINLPNVTLSSMSHLDYITLLGETGGVPLSRLDCKTPTWRGCPDPSLGNLINKNYICLC